MVALQLLFQRGHPIPLVEWRDDPLLPVHRQNHTVGSQLVVLNTTPPVGSFLKQIPDQCAFHQSMFLPVRVRHFILMRHHPRKHHQPIGIPLRPDDVHFSDAAFGRKAEHRCELPIHPGRILFRQNRSPKPVQADPVFGILMVGDLPHVFHRFGVANSREGAAVNRFRQLQRLRIRLWRRLRETDPGDREQRERK
jgi:hypothetical protein